jgi:hypothetical protein
MPFPSLGHNTLLTSQFGNPVSRVWSLFRTIKGLMHFATSRFSHNHSDHLHLYLCLVYSLCCYNIFTITYWITIGLLST